LEYLQKDFLKTQSREISIGDWNDEYLTQLPAEKPVVLLQSSRLVVTEYPHAFFPHPYIQCDVLIVLLNSALSCRNLIFFANEMKDSTILFLLQNPFNWRSEDCQEIEDLLCKI
jgi:hypothetical protein